MNNNKTHYLLLVYFSFNFQFFCFLFFLLICYHNEFILFCVCCELLGTFISPCQKNNFHFYFTKKLLLYLFRKFLRLLAEDLAGKVTGGIVTKQIFARKKIRSKKKKCKQKKKQNSFSKINKQKKRKKNFFNSCCLQSSYNLNAAT